MLFFYSDRKVIRRNRCFVLFAIVFDLYVIWFYERNAFWFLLFILPPQVLVKLRKFSVNFACFQVFLTWCLPSMFPWSMSHVLNVDKYLWMIKYAHKGLLGNVSILAPYQTNPSVNDLGLCLEMDQVDSFKMNHMWNRDIFWRSQHDSEDTCTV